MSVNRNIDFLLKEYKERLTILQEMSKDVENKSSTIERNLTMNIATKANAPASMKDIRSKYDLKSPLIAELRDLYTQNFEFFEIDNPKYNGGTSSTCHELQFIKQTTTFQAAYKVFPEIEGERNVNEMVFNPSILSVTMSAEYRLSRSDFIYLFKFHYFSQVWNNYRWIQDCLPTEYDTSFFKLFDTSTVLAETKDMVNRHFQEIYPLLFDFKDFKHYTCLSEFCKEHSYKVHSSEPTKYNAKEIFQKEKEYIAISDSQGNVLFFLMEGVPEISGRKCLFVSKPAEYQIEFAFVALFLKNLNISMLPEFKKRLRLYPKKKNFAKLFLLHFCLSKLKEKDS